MEKMKKILRFVLTYLPLADQDIVPKKIKFSEYLAIIEKENKEDDDLY
jgi:hypothetical protein